MKLIVHHTAEPVSRYNKSRNNLQTDIRKNHHLNNNHEENEVLFYLYLCSDK